MKSFNDKMCERALKKYSIEQLKDEKKMFYLAPFIPNTVIIFAILLGLLGFYSFVGHSVTQWAASELVIPIAQ